ncbi:MAG TPA: hypothetical protein VGM14_25715 [Streptosporangiaceae bacterium]|jgi:hypothetical protein
MPATRLITGLSAVLIAAAAWTGSTAAATAAGRTAAKPKDQASLAAVSCRGSNWCMAVGTYTAKSKVHALAQVWNGSKWRIVRGVPGTELSSVSCVTDTFCVGAGGPTGAEQWNGRAWRTVNLGKPDGGLTGITCGSRASCMLIFPRLDGPEVQSWSGGTKWHVWAKATNVCFGPAGAPCGLAGVSCGSATNCVAVGTTQYQFSSDQKPSSVVWNGKSWAFSQPPGVGDPAEMNAVSCAGQFCLAVGSGDADVLQGTIAIAATWNAATRSWTDVSPKISQCGQASCAWASVISCGSQKICMTLGHAGSQVWDGQRWGAAPTIAVGHASGLPAVSCGLTICMAVGHQSIGNVRHSLTELWNGNGWILQRPVNPF